MKDHKYLFFAVLAGVAVLIPALIWGIPNGADLQNHLRFVLPLYDELSVGNIIPGWLAESNNGYGDPRFRFYPPLLYYVLSLFRSLTGDWYIAVLLVFTLSSAIATTGIYLWAKQTLTKQTAFFAAVVFAIMPYHLTQFYQASLLAEFFAASFLPFCFLFVERLQNPREPATTGQNIFNTLCLGIFYALVVMTHIPTTVILSLSLGLYALLLSNKKNYKKGLLLCAIGILIGLLLSSWFWVKMLSELGFIQAGINVSSPHYDYRNNFIFSPFAIVNLNTWYANLNAVLTICLFLPVIVIAKQLFRREPDEKLSSFLVANNKIAMKSLNAALVIAVVVFLMTTDLSRPLWAIIPKLKDIQFPFRWLIIVSIMICPLAALSLQILKGKLKQNNIFHYLLITVLIASIGYTVYDLVISSDYKAKAEFTDSLDKIRGARSFNDWLPRGAKEIKDLAPMDGQANAGNRQITDEYLSSHKRIFRVAAGDETEIRIRAYNYPLWHVYQSNGQELPINKTDDGIISVTIPNNETNLELRFVETRVVKAILIMSMLSWLAVILLLSYIISLNSLRLYKYKISRKILE